MFFFENRFIKEHLTKLLKKLKLNSKKTVKSIDLAENKVLQSIFKIL